MELRNYFSTPEATSEMEEEPTINSKWNTIKTIYSETAQKVLGFNQKGAKEWISREEATEDKDAEHQVPTTPRETKMPYENKDREVKRSARREKRVFVEHLASEAEKAAAYGNLGTVYKITKRLTKRLPASGREEDVWTRSLLCVTSYNSVINFMDFRKAFDSVHRNTLWTILHS